MFTKPFLFTSFRSWRVCMMSGVRKFLWGTTRIATCIVFGILSIFAWIGRLISDFASREKVAAVIIGILLFILSFGWITTYVSTKTQLTTVEYQRDSIGYVLDRYMQAYDSVIVDGDTIKNYK